MAITKLQPKSRKISGFTLVELIVVITILAILATIGFLALSGYSQDAKDSAIKANVRSLQTAISSEAAITNQSPRYYVVHDTDYALSGAFAYVDGASVALTGGDVGSAPTDSNYTAGKPDFKKLKLNPDKFRISSAGLPGGTLGVIARATGLGTESVEASYDPASLMAAGADFMTAGANGKKRATSYVQTAGISPATKLASVMGNFPTTNVPAGNASGLLRAEPGSATNLTGALLDWGKGAGQSVSAPIITAYARLLSWEGVSADGLSVATPKYGRVTVGNPINSGKHYLEVQSKGYRHEFGITTKSTSDVLSTTATYPLETQSYSVAAYLTSVSSSVFAYVSWLSGTKIDGPLSVCTDTNCTVGMAVDADTNTVTWYGPSWKMGSYTVHMAKPWYVAIERWNSNAGGELSATFNFWESPFSYSVPSGYRPGFGE